MLSVPTEYSVEWKHLHEGTEENHEEPIMIISVPAEIQTKYDSTELLLLVYLLCWVYLIGTFQKLDLFPSSGIMGERIIPSWACQLKSPSLDHPRQYPT
jgi:hypothetical protein